MKEVASATSSVSYADTFPIGEGFRQRFHTYELFRVLLR